jgi:hypothetical protein
LAGWLTFDGTVRMTGSLALPGYDHDRCEIPPLLERLWGTAPTPAAFNEAG